jgi:C-7 ketoreductase
MKPRSVIITGGGTGLGRATARRFAAQGDRVLIVGRTAAKLEEAAEGYDDIRTLAADITKPGEGERIVQAALDHYGQLDVLVNNAGVGVFAPMGQIEFEQAHTQFDTNVLGPIFLTQAALDPLEAAGGTIVNISSAGSLGIRAWPENSVYWATKAALNVLTRCWASGLASRGIRVLSLAPGVADTGIGERIGWTEEQYQGFLSGVAAQVPAGRVGTPEEMAWWITTLVHPEATYATGSILPIDGGLSLT